MKVILKFLICGALLCFFSAGSALALEEPQKVVEAKINEILNIVARDNAAGKSEAQKVESLRGVILEVTDLTEMSKRALGINYKKFSPEQQQEFARQFATMLENIYLVNIAGYRDQKVVFGKTVTLKPDEAVEVQSEIVFADGKKMPVFYRISNKTGAWLVYDVVIEGISFIKNYRDQFKDLLTKNSPEQLLNIMRQKNAEGLVK